ncbi:hypothetical protein [uncultured Bartonella sp.]|uniref:hypothetical protein n=1 Tax=uncultured Bartonella sp. TaxID=104108 RepID=UPI002606DEAF|nr:hypothetical protein [uncultured Bartonella sp.]
MADFISSFENREQERKTGFLFHVIGLINLMAAKFELQKFLARQNFKFQNSARQLVFASVCSIFYEIFQHQIDRDK